MKNRFKRTKVCVSTNESGVFSYSSLNEASDKSDPIFQLKLNELMARCCWQGAILTDWECTWNYLQLITKFFAVRFEWKWGKLNWFIGVDTSISRCNMISRLIKRHKFAKALNSILRTIFLFEFAHSFADSAVPCPTSGRMIVNKLTHFQFYWQPNDWCFCSMFHHGRNLRQLAFEPILPWALITPTVVFYHQHKQC